jgi:hypothetical protein
VFNDAWLLDLGSGGWLLLESELAPEPRAFHSATLVQDQLVVFGGMNLHK